MNTLSCAEDLVNLLRDPISSTPELRCVPLKVDCYGRTIDGYLYQNGKDGWYRIENYIIDSLPPQLRNHARWEAFSKKYGLHYNHMDNLLPNCEELKEQKEQINFFHTNSLDYDKEVTNLVFYQASDQLCLNKWINKIAMRGVKIVLDIGGGTGRQAIPLAEKNFSVISTDISEEMLIKSVEKAKSTGSIKNILYILADCTNLPLNDKCVDAIIAYGVLHHLPNPKVTIKEAARVLKNGGFWYSYDPHNSKLRFIFDVFMKWKCLYQEKANSNPLIDSRELENWCVSCGLKINIRFHGFILPHLLLPFGSEISRMFLKVTDTIASHLPFIRRLGGVIISDGIKNNS